MYTIKLYLTHTDRTITIAGVEDEEVKKIKELFTSPNRGILTQDSFIDKSTSSQIDLKQVCYIKYIPEESEEEK